MVDADGKLVGLLGRNDMIKALKAQGPEARVADVMIARDEMQGRLQILLNLAEVSYIDSTGLGELVSSYSTVTRHRGQIKLLNLTTKVQDLLAICRLSTVFETFESEAEALSSFTVVSAV